MYSWQPLPRKLQILCHDHCHGQRGILDVHDLTALEFIPPIQTTNCHPRSFGLCVDHYSNLHGTVLPGTVLVVSGVGTTND